MEHKKGLTLNQLKRLDRLRIAYDNRRPHITKKNLAAECHYNERYIAHLFAGSRPISDNAVEVLAPALLVRKEYLYGIDDVMTEKECRRRKEFTDAFTALIEYSVNNTTGSFEYSFVGPDTDLSDFEDMDAWDLEFIRRSQAEGYHLIIKVSEDPYGDEEYDLSVIDDDSYFRLVRDICDFITLRVAHAFDENHMQSLMSKMDMILPLLRGK